MPHDITFSIQPLIGMVHLCPLPGSARFINNLDTVLNSAVEDALTLERGGVNAVLIENYFDSPFVKNDAPPVTIAAMTRAVLAVRQAVSIPCGVNVLRNDVRSAISIAHVCGASFVRCNVYVGAVVADQGIIEGAARAAIMLRRELGADVKILADVCVKHASPLSSVSLEQQARDAEERGLADAIIVTGASTGAVTSISDVLAAKSVVGIPVLVGSGLTVENAGNYAKICDGAIVGSGFKHNGIVSKPIDPMRVKAFVASWMSGRDG